MASAFLKMANKGPTAPHTFPLRIEVHKFGGSSLKSAEAIDHVVSIIKERQSSSRTVVVLSAIGDTTRTLVQCLQKAVTADGENEALTELSRLEVMHQQLLCYLGVAANSPVQTEIARLFEKCSAVLRALYLLKESSGRACDFVMSLGERLSVRVFAAAAAHRGLAVHPIDADYDFIVTRPSEATGSTSAETVDVEFDEESFRRARTVLYGVWECRRVPAVTGFIAAHPDGVPVTLGRSGSDLTATTLGAVVGAAAVYIWTDTAGVLTCDPRVIPNAKSIATLSYEEAVELAHLGAKVLHPRCVSPAAEANIPVIVARTENPDGPSTRIMRCPSRRGAIVGLSSKSPVALIDIRALGMTGRWGFLADVFAVFRDLKISVDVIATSEVSISVTLDRDTCATQVDRLVARLGKFAVVNLHEPKAMLALVGDAGVAAAQIIEAATKVLATCAIPIDMVSVGASRMNVSLVIGAAHLPRAMQAVHDAFFHD